MFLVLNYTLSSGVHVQNLQVCYIVIHMPLWLAASITLASILGISPNAILPNHSTPCCPSPSPPPCNRPWSCDVPLPVSMCSHCSAPTHEWEHAVFIWFSVLVSVCWEWWFPASSMSLQRTWTHPFLWLHSIPLCIWATFSLSSLSWMSMWVGSRSLLL